MNRSNLTDDTICGYLQAAVTWLRHEYSVPVPLYTNNQGTKKSERLHPYLAELLGQRRTWGKKKSKREPLTGHIIDTMRDLAGEICDSDPNGYLRAEPVLYDFIRVASFTGSRLAEYGQSALPKGSPPDGWATIPNNRDVPNEWRNKPAAFVRDDFEFFDQRRVQMKHRSALRHPRRVQFVRVRFRYDKSKFNFIFRTFQKTGSHLCCVTAALSIIDRADRWNLARFDPLGMYLDRNNVRRTIRGKHVSNFMQRACVETYANPQHYLRIHIKRLLSHSCRTFAAVALSNAGVSEDDIAYRLRWNSDAVKLYLRDCYRMISDLTSRAVAGAYATIGF